MPTSQETVLCREAEIKKQKAEHARLADELRVQQQACEDLKTSIAQAELNCGSLPHIHVSIVA